MGSDNSKNENSSRYVSLAAAERALEEQRRKYEQRLQDIQNRPVVYVQTQPAPAPLPELQRAQNMSRPLYPNLSDSGNLPPSHEHTGYQQSPVRANNNNFVFVKSPANRVTPSAPPAPPSPPQQQRSSRARPGSDNEINCPTCKKRFGVKIFNCMSGHASCMNCQMAQRPCALCDATITQMRNISVEEFVLQVKVPCENEKEGCCLNFKLADMEEHLKECPFREMKCILPGGLCNWKGKLSLLATHFENFHKTFKGEVDTELFIQTQNIFTNKRMQLIKIGNFNFVFNLKVSESKNCIYITVQLLGTKHSAAKWSYEVHVYDKSAPRRKYQHTDKCFSNSEPLENLEKESRCAVIPLPYAKTFINNGAIAYKFFIKKDSVTNGEPRRDFSSNRRDVSSNRRDVSSNSRGVSSNSRGVSGDYQDNRTRRGRGRCVRK